MSIGVLWQEILCCSRTNTVEQFTSKHQTSSICGYFLSLVLRHICSNLLISCNCVNVYVYAIILCYIPWNFHIEWLSHDGCSLLYFIIIFYPTLVLKLPPSPVLGILRWWPRRFRSSIIKQHGCQTAKRLISLPTTTHPLLWIYIYQF